MKPSRARHRAYLWRRLRTVGVSCALLSGISHLAAQDALPGPAGLDVQPLRANRRNAGVTEPRSFPSPSDELGDPTLGRLPRRPTAGASLPEAQGDPQYQKHVAQRVDATHRLDVQLDKPTILRFKSPPFRDQVADEEILEALNLTETEYSLTGRAVGTTVVNFWFENASAPGGHEVLSYVVRVLDDEASATHDSQRYENLLGNLEREVNRAFPNSAVTLTYVGNQVVVRGQAKDVDEASQIIRIVSGSIPNVKQVETARQFDNTAVLTSAEEVVESGGYQGIAQGQTGTGVNAARVNSRVINLLEVAGVHQVMLKVTVAEVNRSATRAIGADLRIGGGSSNFFSISPGSASGGLSPSEFLDPTNPLAVGATVLVNRGDFDLALNALKTLNLARSLAEPNLVTLNGQPARFRVGGEFPVPQVTGFTASGLQGVEFVPFGVQLNFVPIITDNDRIRLTLQATVSTRDPSLGTTIGGTGGGTGSAVPGLNSRTFQTTVELRDGQTIAIAGLIQNNLSAQSSRFPFLGDILVFGRLFANDNTSFGEQELIVLVTPYQVAPVEAEPRLPLPGSDFFEPDDLEFFLHGSLTGCRAEDFRSSARTDCEKIKAFRSLEQHYIIGQPGHSNGQYLPSSQTPRKSF